MKDSKEMWAVSSDLTYGKVNALYDIEDNKATHYAFDGSTAYSEVAFSKIRRSTNCIKKNNPPTPKILNFIDLSNIDSFRSLGF